MVIDNIFLDKQTMLVVGMLYVYHQIAYRLVVKHQCLLLSGDVELNPGPLDQGGLLKLIIKHCLKFVYSTNVY